MIFKVRSYMVLHMGINASDLRWDNAGLALGNLLPVFELSQLTGLSI